MSGHLPPRERANYPPDGEHRVAPGIDIQVANQDGKRPSAPAQAGESPARRRRIWRGGPLALQQREDLAPRLRRFAFRFGLLLFGKILVFV